MRRFAHWVDKGRWAFLTAWVVAVVALHIAAPDWNRVTQDGQFSFLPLDAPSRVANALFEKAFPRDVLSSSIVVVASRPPGQRLSDVDRDFVTQTLKPRIASVAGPIGPADAAQAKKDPVAQIHAADDRGTGALLTSADGGATLVVLELNTDPFSHDNGPLTQRVEDVLKQVREEHLVPSGLALDLTGSAVVGRDINVASQQSADNTSIWTIVLVVALTLLVFRAPLLALIPLVTLYVSMTVALKGLALLAGAGVVHVFKGIEAYCTVVVYASGVDYCLFLISRFQEELHSGGDTRTGVRDALAKVGAALAASSCTEIAGIGMMAFARFGKFQQAGIAISLSLCVMLAAVLTLTPVLLQLAGRFAFWPRHLQTGPQSASAENRPDRFHRLWERIAGAVTYRPRAIGLATLIVMLPLAIVGFWSSSRLNYDLVSNLAEDAPSALGTRVLMEHFPAGAAGPIYMLQSNPKIDFHDSDAADAIADLTNHLNDHRDELKIADIRSLSAPLGTTGLGKEAQEKPLSERLFTQVAMRRRAQAYYVNDESQGGHVTRLVLELTLNPFSEEAIDYLGPLQTQIARMLPGDLQEGTQVLMSGSTASLRDLKEVGGGDRTRIMALVVVSICVILVILLRRPVVVAYLLMTVLFSYLVTLGITFGAFHLFSHREFVGLDWTVPLFLFTVLIAIGEDYNILLVTRIEEEHARGHGEAIRHALVITGPIISSCGIIMAGTFLSLAIGGRLAQMTQLGVALSVGVLLDTFVVRPILVPAGMLAFPSLAVRARTESSVPAVQAGMTARGAGVTALHERLTD